jgi:hypothetical protein
MHAYANWDFYYFKGVDQDRLDIGRWGHKTVHLAWINLLLYLVTSLMSHQIITKRKGACANEDSNIYDSDIESQERLYMRNAAIHRFYMLYVLGLLKKLTTPLQ